MKKALKIVVVLIAVPLVLIQFVRPDLSNAPVNLTETLEASAEVPDGVKGVLARSCANCHTNTTQYPWYSNVAPISWLMANDIRDGRAKLNFSVWNTYSNKRKATKLEDICEQVKEGAMPLPSYLWMHGDAALSEAERNLLCDWANAERAKIPQ